MTMLTSHFSEAELTCRCGCGRCYMNAAFMTRLEALRVAFNEPINVSSAFRCNNYNMKVGGKSDSQHLIGKAVDILIVSPGKRFQLVSLAIAFGFRGIGVDGAFVHVDTRAGEPVLWLY